MFGVCRCKSQFFSSVQKNQFYALITRSVAAVNVQVDLLLKVTFWISQGSVVTFYSAMDNFINSYVIFLQNSEYQTLLKSVDFD